MARSHSTAGSGSGSGSGPESGLARRRCDARFQYPARALTLRGGQAAACATLLPLRTPTPRRDAGFMIAPILYVLALAGVGAAVLFSGYSQILRTNIEITRNNNAKNELQAANRTLSASSTLINGGLNLQPPAELAFGSIPGADLAKLPSGYSNVGTTGSPTSDGVLAPASGVKQLDPWNHFYIYCRWENLTNPGTDPAILIISAGPDGTLNTKCGDTAAKQDDIIQQLSVGAAIDRANVWQYQTTTGGNQVQFGVAANAVKVTNTGDITANSLTLSGALNAGSVIFTAPVPIASGGTAATTAAGARTNLGATSMGDYLFSAGSYDNALATAARGTLLGAGTVGDAVFVAATATGARSALGAGAIGDPLFTAVTATGARSTLGAGATGDTLFTATTATGARGILGATAVGDALFTAASAAAGRAALGAGTTGDSLFTATTATGARTTLGAGTVGGAVFIAPDQTTALTALGLIGGSGTLDVNITGTANTATNLADGANILAGVVAIAHGGTGAATAAAARVNLGTNDATNLTTGTLDTALLPNSGVIAGAYNWGTVTSKGLVTAATNVVSSALQQNNTSITLTDTTAGVGTDGQINFTVEGTTQGVMDYRGFVGLGTTAPEDRLHVAGGNIRLEGATATNRMFSLTTGSSKRWDFGANNAAESGGATGSNFVFKNYDDAGSLLGIPITIDRATGNVTFTGTVTAPVFSGGGGGGSTSLGTSLAATNPARTGEVTTGLYTPSSGVVGIGGLGADVARFTGSGSQVNYFNFTGATTGNNPTVAVAGTDANIGVTVTPKGTGNFNLSAGAYQLGGVNGLQLTTTGNPIIGNTTMSTSLAPLSVGIGRNALAAATGELYDVAIGHTALTANTSAGGNTAVGFEAQMSTITGSSNTAVGFRALRLNTANWNSAFGAGALSSNTTAGGNSAFGVSSLTNNTTGSANTAFGHQVMMWTTTGYSNTGVGSNALYTNVNGRYNVAMGEGTLFTATGSDGSTALGYNALYSTTTGGNTAVGYRALTNTTTGDSNAALGYNALANNTTGIRNTALGFAALQGSTTATHNTAVGFDAGVSLQTGSANVVIGHGAMTMNVSGGSNIIIGYNAMYSGTGGGNVAIGTNAGGGYPSGGLTSGQNNTILGSSVASTMLATGSSNILIGTSSAVDTPAAGTSNWLNIGNTIYGDLSNNRIALGSGITTTSAGVTFDLGNVTDSMRLPLGTTAQRPGTPLQAMVRYNSTTGTGGPEYYDGAAWQALLSTATGGGGTQILGAAAATANPQRSGEANTGLFSAATGQVSVTTLGTEVGRFTAAGLNLITATGALQINSLNALKMPNATSVVVGNSNATALTGAGNTAVGYQALNATTTGTWNTAVGSQALVSNTTGYGNGAFGNSTLWANTTGTYNNGFGYYTLNANTTGHDNNAYGNGALQLSTTGNFNSAFGSIALGFNLSGSQNGAFGTNALVNNTTASDNNAFGVNALRSTTTGGANNAFGVNALYNAIGTYNTAVGDHVGTAITTGSSNLVLGSNVATTTLTTGSNNILLGTSSAVDTPAAGTSSWLNIGNTIYGDLSNHRIALGNAITTTNAGVTLDLGNVTDSMRMPVGTTVQRPASGLNGMIRYNSNNDKFEAYQGGSWQDILTNAGGGSTITLGPSTAAANPQRSGEANTGLFSPATGVVAVTSLGTEALRVTATGSVGIGTTAPVGQLTVYEKNAPAINVIGVASVNAGNADLYLQTATGNGVWDLSVNSANGSFAVYDALSGRAPLVIEPSALINSLYITSTGSVGINTASPTTKLDVNGTGNFSDILSIPGGVGANPGFHFSTIGTADSYGPNIGFGLDTSFNIVAAVSDVGFKVVNRTGGVPFIVASTGNVGVGTVAPSTGVSLDISGRTDSIRLPVGNTAARPATPLQAMVRYNSMTGQGAVEYYDGAVWQSVANSSGSGATNVLGSSAAAANPQRSGEANTGLFSPATGVVAITSLGTEALRITATGSIGIGTSTPPTKLSIIGSDESVSVAHLNWNYSTPTHIGAKFGTWSGSTILNAVAGTKFSRWQGTATNTTVGYIGQAAYGSGDYGLDFRLDSLAADGDATTSRMYIATSGNVGIGTTTPGAPLQIEGGISSFSTSGVSNVRLGGNTASTPATPSIVFDNGSTTWDLDNLAGGDKLRFVYNGLTVPMVITSTGNLGVGVQAPLSRLDVSGGAALGTYAGVIVAPSNGLIVSGQVGVATSAPAAGVALDISGATNSLRLPLGTTVQRPATPLQAMVRYNSTTGQGALEYYDGAVWQSVANSSGSGATNVLGTSAAAANPQRSGEANTGLFSGATGEVSVATLGTEVGRFTAAGLNLITATGALQINSLNALKLTTTGNPIIGNTAMSASLAPLSIGIGRDALAAVTAERFSVAVGHTALSANTTGSGNVAIGYTTLLNNINGGGNVAVGYTALKANTSGSFNTAIGGNALLASTNGTQNTAVGYQPLAANTSGAYNTALGASALNASTTGNNNTAAGYMALAFNTTGSNNTAVGYQAIRLESTGDDNTSVGYQALYNTSTGSSNTALGKFALKANTSGSSNVGIGIGVASTTLSTGSNNILIGTSSAVDTPAAGTNNWLNLGGTVFGDMSAHQIALGSGISTLNSGVTFDLGSTTDSMRLPLGNTVARPSSPLQAMLRYNSTTGQGVLEYYDGAAWQGVAASSAITNTITLGTAAAAANPQRSGEANTGLFSGATGEVSVATLGTEVGRFTAAGLNLITATGALQINSVNALKMPATNNIVIGNSSATATTGSSNIAVGTSALNATTTGTDNIGMGVSALAANTVGQYNVAIGSSALLNSATVSGQVAIGTSALAAATTATGNMAIGYQALLNTTTGSNNMAIGQQALSLNTTGANNIALGYQAMQNHWSGAANTGTFNIAIGSWALGGITSEGGNVVIGGNAAVYSYGSAMTVIGASALGDNSNHRASDGSTIVGAASWASGTYNAIVGAEVGNWGGGSGSANSVVGYQALNHASSASNNAVVGVQAGFNVTTGGSNLILGHQVGNTTLAAGSNNILIGTSSAVDTPAAGTNNWLNLGGTVFGDMSAHQIALGSGISTLNSGVTFDLGSTTDSMRLPLGNTAARPSSPLQAMLRYNSTTGQGVLEYYDGAAWQGVAASSAITNTITLGTAAAAANPQRSGEANTGLFTGATGQVSVTTLGTEVGRFNTTGLNLITATGALQINSMNGLKLTTTGNPIMGNTAMSASLAPLSIGIGRNALAAVTGEVTSVAVGHQALEANTSGAKNTAVGYQAMQFDTTGVNNTAVGYQGLASLTTGNQNTAIGDRAGASTTTGSWNTFVGQSAGYQNIDGASNSFFGRSAGESTTSGSNNIFAGRLAGFANTTGSNNVAVGYQVGNTTLATGSNNILIGTSSAVDTPAAGTSNWLNLGGTVYGDLSNHRVAIGSALATTNAGVTLDLGSNTDSMRMPKGTTAQRPGTPLQAMLRYNSTTGQGVLEYYDGAAWQGVAASSAITNTITLGTAAAAANPQRSGEANTGLFSGATGEVSVATLGTEVGRFTAAGLNLITATGALQINSVNALKMPATNNIVIGNSSATATTGSSNIAVGTSALNATTTGTDNIGMGVSALAANTVGQYNVAIGSSALAVTTTGSGLVAIGYQALNADTTGAQNTAVGFSAMKLVADGSFNAAFGYGTLQAATSAAVDTAVGHLAMSAMVDGANNTALGAGAMKLQSTGDSNTAIGANALGNATNTTRNVAIGDWALRNSTTGIYNTAVGQAAGGVITTGSYNTLLGQSAGISLTTGSKNIAVGYNTASATLTTGTGNILIGDAVTTPASSTSNWLNLGGTVFGDLSNKRIAIGSGVATTNAGVTFDLGSNTDSMRMTLGTTAQRPGTPLQAMLRYNTTTGQGAVEYYDGAAWQSVAAAGGSSTSTLGTSAAAANPQRSGEANTGLFSGASGQVSVTTLGTEIGQWTASGLNLITATGALQINSMNGLKLSVTGNPIIGNTAMNASLAPLSVGIGRSASAAVTGEVNSVAVGHLALAANTSGLYNTAVGSQALRLTTTGTSNTALGYTALFANTTGSNNTAAGLQALTANTTGSNNSAFGDQALFASITGSSNAAFGYRALFSNAADGNTAFGYQAMLLTTTGVRNVAVGADALDVNTGGTDNTAVGKDALGANTTGSYNVALGGGSLTAATTATGNTAVGYQVLYSTTTGIANTAFGYQAMYVNSSGSYNMASGHQALYANTTGVNNTAAGSYALWGNVTGSSNAAVGTYASYGNSSGTQNSAFGNYALYTNTTGSNNNAFGYRALYATTTGAQNNAFGQNALQSNTTGQYNVAMGNTALAAATTSSGQVAIGASALAVATTATGNTAVGYQALLATTTGSANTVVGYNSGATITTGTGNIIMGSGSGSATLTTGNNNILLGNGITTTAASTAKWISLADQLVLDWSTTGSEAMGINRNTTGTAGTTALIVGSGSSNGNGALLTAAGVWTNASDRRIKEDIQPLGYGLDTVMRLKPVAYKMKDTHEPQIGFIAQDVETVLPEVVVRPDDVNDPAQHYTMSYGNMVAVTVKAIQELKAENDNLRAEVAALRAGNAGAGGANPSPNLSPQEGRGASGWLIVVVGGGLFVGLLLVGVAVGRLRREMKTLKKSA